MSTIEPLASHDTCPEGGPLAFLAINVRRWWCAFLVSPTKKAFLPTKVETAAAMFSTAEALTTPDAMNLINN